MNKKQKIAVCLIWSMVIVVPLAVVAIVPMLSEEHGQPYPGSHGIVIQPGSIETEKMESYKTINASEDYYLLYVKVNKAKWDGQNAQSGILMTRTDWIVYDGSGPNKGKCIKCDPDFMKEEGKDVFLHKQQGAT